MSIVLIRGALLPQPDSEVDMTKIEIIFFSKKRAVTLIKPPIKKRAWIVVSFF
jgi:hypothetical protein